MTSYGESVEVTLFWCSCCRKPKEGRPIVLHKCSACGEIAFCGVYTRMLFGD